MTAVKVCAICGAEATGRCVTCKEVYCVGHYTIKGGGMDNIYIECDLCAEKRRAAEIQLAAQGRNSAIIGLLIGGGTTVTGLALFLAPLVFSGAPWQLFLVGLAVAFVGGLILHFTGLE